MPTLTCIVRLALALAAAAAMQGAVGQGVAAPPVMAALPASQSASSPSTSAAPPTSPPPAPSSDAPTQQIDVTARRATTTDLRRESTASTIVVGRDEIGRFGDSSLFDVLKRLPGITVDGPPGNSRVGMRGLPGYTQILLDGQPTPPGFSVDSIAPDQIERIEILPAPTAETGARAIAGTINIVTREGHRKRLSQANINLREDRGRWSPSGSWTREDARGPFSYSFSVAANDQSDVYLRQTTTTDVDSTGAPTLRQRESVRSQYGGPALNMSGRLEWKLDGEGSILQLSPFFASNWLNDPSDSQLQTQLGTPGPNDPDFDHSHTDYTSRYQVSRLNGLWRTFLADGTKIESRVGVANSDNGSHRLRREFDASDVQTDESDEVLHTQSPSATLGLKASRLLDNDHSLVGGAEFEALSLVEDALLDGAPEVPEGERLRSSRQRLAFYGQDEWAPSPHWSLQAGLRWEGIDTRSTAPEADATASPRNDSSVFSPLLHAVWKPDPKGSDLVRFSLTRSYRSPDLYDVIARPTVALHNTETSPDRVGNPGLQPELATGIDLAFEHYTTSDGVLSASAFYRRISNVIRSVVTNQASVAWAAGSRWVTEPQNIGNAVSEGVQLEAKFQVPRLAKDASPLDLRANLSLFESHVDSVTGPDNRFDQQPTAAANLGADYRLRSVPLSLGANLALRPGYDTRLSELQTVERGYRRNLDAYGLWVFNPMVQMRLSINNLAPVTGETSTTVGTETAQSFYTPNTVWQLRLEMKL